jgi:hypothetical protein
VSAVQGAFARSGARGLLLAVWLCARVGLAQQAPAPGEPATPESATPESATPESATPESAGPQPARREASPQSPAAPDPVVRQAVAPTAVPLPPLPQPLPAAERAPEEPAPSLLAAPVEIHAFVSQGFILSAENDYLASTKTGSLEFSEVGVNLTKTLPENLRVGVQLFAHDLGTFGNFAPQFDWYYLDWHPKDWLGIRVGRLKMPFGLYNELNDVDAARVPILLPQSIYQVDHREYLFALAGGELYGDLQLGDAGSLEYRAYGGTLPGQLPTTATTPGVTVSRVAIPYVYGGRLFWSTPITGLLAGFSAQAVRFDADYVLDPTVRTALEGLQLLPPGLANPLAVKFRVPRWIASLQYAAYDLDLTAEYSRWIGKFYSPAPGLFPPHTVNERYYAMASYHVSSWFTPGLYYSGYFPNVKDRHGRESFQHDLAATTRFDLTQNWLVKLEGHLMVGTAALDNRALNQGAAQNTLAKTWGVFLIKTTAYF